MARFRVLALDGGGIRGAFTAAVLSALDEEVRARHGDARLVDHFDLICGTSTGGLLALALGLGVEPGELPDLYENFGDEIFPRADGQLSRIAALYRQVTGAKHDPVGLVRVLGEKFGNRVLGDSTVRLAIPAYDVTMGRIFVFKTAHHERFRHDVNIPAVDIARCTSAAPTYFPPEEVGQHRNTTYVDGGVWANNPSMVGLVEALHFCGAELNDIEMLNIGTTSTVEDYSGVDEVWWKLKLPSLLMAGPAEAAQTQATLMLGDRFHRIDRMVPADWSGLDDTAHVEELIATGRAVAVMRKHLEPVLERFLDGEPAPPFEPFHHPTGV